MRLILFLLLIITGASCQTSNLPDTDIVIFPIEKSAMSDEIRGNGKIVWNDFEGGFYGIIDEAGKRYYPLEPLEEVFRVDGTKVRFVLHLNPNVMTTVMWGTPVSVVKIEKITQ